jgi:predicted nucleic acid-binding protein
LRIPCRAIVDALGDGRLTATTTIEVIQEFVHVHSRRGRRTKAVEHGRDFIRLLSPLRPAESEDLEAGLTLFARHPSLGAFDAVLAAVVIRGDMSALVSADRAFRGIAGLNHVDPGSATAIEALLGRPSEGEAGPVPDGDPRMR